jgi:hypothetical protein
MEREYSEEIVLDGPALTLTRTRYAKVYTRDLRRTLISADSTFTVSLQS